MLQLKNTKNPEHHQREFQFFAELHPKHLLWNRNNGKELNYFWSAALFHKNSSYPTIRSTRHCIKIKVINDSEISK